MNSKKDNKALKALTIVLALSLIALGVFTVKFYTEEQENKAILENEKKDLENNLQDILSRYEEVLSENSENKQDLLAAKERIEVLLDSVKGMKVNLALLTKFRRDIFNLEKEKERLFHIVDSLNSENNLLAAKIDSTTTILMKEILLKDSLATENTSLVNKVEIGSKIAVSNLKAEAVKIKSSGKTVSTERSRRANSIKTCFTILKNPLAQSGEKEFFIQIIDPKNNLVGGHFSKTFGQEVLKYSEAANVYYENEDLDVCIMIEEEDLVEGYYTANIFEGPELLGKKFFKLK